MQVRNLNSDGPILGLLNRHHWEILEQDLEELNIYVFKDTTKEEIKQIDRNVRLADKLIEFCVKHFKDYEPAYEEDF